MKYLKYLSLSLFVLPFTLGAGSAQAGTLNLSPTTTTPADYCTIQIIDSETDPVNYDNGLTIFNADTGQPVEPGGSGDGETYMPVSICEANFGLPTSLPAGNYVLIEWYASSSEWGSCYCGGGGVGTSCPYYPDWGNLHPEYFNLASCRLASTYLSEASYTITENGGTPTPLPAGLWTGGLTYGGATASISAMTAAVGGDMIPIALIVIGISLGLYLLTYVIGQFKQKKSKEKDEFSNPEK